MDTVGEKRNPLRIAGCMCTKSEDGHKLCKECNEQREKKNENIITKHKMKMNANKHILLCNIIIIVEVDIILHTFTLEFCSYKREF